MRWRLARPALAAVAVLVIVIVGAVLAILHLPALEEARSRMAANLLSSYLGEAVVVNGGVDVNFGRTIDVSVQGVSPATAPTGAPAPTPPVGALRMSFSLDAALRGRLDLTALDLSSLRVIIDAAEPSTETLGRRVSSAVEGVLSSPLVRSLKLRDVRILRINDPAGWNGSLFFDTVTSRATDRAGAVSVEAKGSLNGQAFTLSGKAPDLSPNSGAARGGDMSLKLSFKGIEAELNGRLAQDAGELTLAGRLDVKSPSLGDVQDVMKLARMVEGTGRLALALDGALATLAIGSAKLRIETADDRVYEADGEVADMWAAAGVDVGFVATLVPPGATKGKSRFDLAPRAIKGRLSGKVGEFESDDVVVETGLALIELENIGPIRIGQIARDEKGRLRLEDIRLVQGDAKDPILDLTGHLNDALELRDFLLESTLGAGKGTATALGSARIGNTDLEGRLRIAAPKGKPEITGKISSKDLHLDDLTVAREVSELFSGRDIDAVKLRKEVQEKTMLSLELAADAVEGGGESSGGLKARVVYAKSRLRVSPVELAYLGGRIKGDVDANFAPSQPALKLKAAVRQLSLERVFKRLDKAPAASGPLDLDLAVTANGADLNALLASMSGQVSGSVRGGSLADRTINLAGQTIVGWMFTRTADGSAPLVCFVARFDFKDGVGTARQLVLETDKVQAIGGGTLDLRDDTVGFVFHPRAKRSELVSRIGPVDVSGPLSNPEIELADGAVAAKAVGDTIGLPFHLLGAILGVDGRPLPDRKPCVVVPEKK